MDMHVDILFTDLICPNPYEPLMLQTSGMGGSESTLLKIAESLGSRGFKVLVHEHNLNMPIAGSNIFLIGNDDLHNISSTKAVIHQRKPNFELLRKYQDAQHILWCHDIFDEKYCHEISPRAPLIFDDIVCVSKWHLEQARSCKASIGFRNELTYIYNPVMDALYNYHEKNTKYDKTKLVWLSSPHKDLTYAVQVLDNLRNKSGIDFRLDVYNPGYIQVNHINHPYVNFRGVMPQGKLLFDASDALCMFMPMNRWLETFCLVAAEMNAINVPVMAYKGRDALDETGGMYLSSSESELIDKVIDMHNNGRYKTRIDKQFSLSRATDNWVKLLTEERS